jgi:hypothetical protein
LLLGLPCSGIVLTVPLLIEWFVVIVFDPHLDFEGAPEYIRTIIVSGLFFIQWFPVGLVLAYLFRLLRLRCHNDAA